MESKRDASTRALHSDLEKVKRQLNSNEAHQSKPAALLNAVESTLTEQGTPVPCPPTALFAAIINTLDQLVKSPDAASQNELIAAALHLLAIVAPHCDGAVLRSTSESLIGILGPLLVTLAETKGEGLAPLLRSILGTLQPVYAALSAKPKLLSKLEVSQLFNTLVPLLWDPRPKVRRKAHEFVWSFVFPASKESEEATLKASQHPYAPRVAETVIRTLETSLKSARSGGKSKGAQHPDPVTSLLSLTAFVKGAAAQWPQEALPALIAVVLSLPRLQNEYLTISSFDVIELLFSPKSSTVDSSTTVKALKALVAMRPPVTATTVLPGWLGGIETGLVALARTDPETCRTVIVSNFEGVLNLCSSEVSSEEVRARAEKAACGMVRWCLGKEDVSDDADEESPLRKVTALVYGALNGLKWRGLGAPHALAILKSLISRMRTRVPGKVKGDPRGPTLAQLRLTEHLKTVGAMRAGKRFEYRASADETIAMAIEVCGPSWVLSILPIDISPDSGREGRAWLLPILAKSVTNTTMSHFTSELLPLSETIFEAKSRAESEGSQAKAKVYSVLIEQIWSTFPAYCDLPVDLSIALTPSIVTLLGNVLQSQLYLRRVVCRGLQVIVEKNLAIVKSSAPAETLRASFGVDQKLGATNLSFVASQSSTLLTVLFNVFGGADRTSRGFILETISTLFSVLSRTDMMSTYHRVMNMLVQSLKAESVSKSRKPEEGKASHTMLDLLIVIAPHLEVDGAKELLDAVQGPLFLSNADPTVQKKCYRILCKLAENTGGQNAIRADLEALIGRLATDSSDVAVAAKRFRTEFLLALVPALPEDALHHLPTLLPEAVLATKEANEKTREASYDLILAMAEKMTQGGVIKRSLIRDMEDDMADDAPASINEFFTMVAAGLAGQTPHMISSTIMALSRLLFEYKDSLPEAAISDLVKTIDLYLTSAAREIVRSALGFVKVAVVCLPLEVIRPHLPGLVPHLLTWSRDHKNHFKLKVRQIFERLIRKFGMEEVIRFVEEDDQKFVTNIRKRQQQAKRKKQRANDQEGDEDEIVRPKGKGQDAYEDVLNGSEDESLDEEDEVLPRSKSAVKRTSAAYLEEDDDEPLDLMDVDEMDRVTASDRLARERRDKGKREKLQSQVDPKVGKIRVLDSDEEEGPSKRSAQSADAYLDAIKGEDSFRRDRQGRVKFNKANKRSREEIEDDVEGVGHQLEALGVEEGQKRKRAKRKNETVQIGAEFKAKRAGGDVKKGDVTPYAYVPLSSVSGGRRKASSKPKVTFKGKGSDRGAKAKALDRRRR